MMSSTNVRSSEDKHVCGGQLIAKDEQTLEMPPKSAKRGPSKLEVVEGPNTTLTAVENIVVKDGKKVIGRATKDGQVLSGDAAKVKQALGQKRSSSDRGR